MKKKIPLRVLLVAMLLYLILFFQARSLTKYLIMRVTPSEELMMAAGQNNINRMNQTLYYGADVNARSYYNRTPLIVAAIHDKAEAARFLLAHGAEPNLKDEKGLTALDLATSEHHPEVAQVLLAAGARP